jgi:hypothetical protein
VIEQDAAGLPELSLLVALGWYLLVMLARDTAAATTAMVVATTR